MFQYLEGQMIKSQMQDKEICQWHNFKIAESMNYH